MCRKHVTVVPIVENPNIRNCRIMKLKDSTILILLDNKDLENDFPNFKFTPSL